MKNSQIEKISPKRISEKQLSYHTWELIENIRNGNYSLHNANILNSEIMENVKFSKNLKKVTINFEGLEKFREERNRTLKIFYFHEKIYRLDFQIVY